jgi:hypothetical protein
MIPRRLWLTTTNKLLITSYAINRGGTRTRNFRITTFPRSPTPYPLGHTTYTYRPTREMISHFTSIFKNQPSFDILAGAEFLEGVRDCCKPAPNLTAPISSLEIKSDLFATKKNKSPGIDGIPYEFYLTFWDVIAPISWICLIIFWKGIPLHHHRDKRQLD